MNLTKKQNQKVEELLAKYYEGERVVNFKAPTGSGKTFMISNFISNILNNNFSNDEKICVMIATISTSELPKEFERKIKEIYNDYLPMKLDVEHIESPSSSSKVKAAVDQDFCFLPEENKILIVGKSSFSSSSIFMKRGIFKAYLDQIESLGYKFIYIRDEAHIGGSGLKGKELSFEKMVQKKASFILKMTATPSLDEQQVILTEEDLLEDNLNLVKSIPRFNPGIELLKDYKNSWEDFMKISFDSFEKTKEKYKDSKVNPAMIIQVDNETEKNNENFEDDLQTIIKELNRRNLEWVIYFGERKETSSRSFSDLKAISKNDSLIDVVIIKVGPTIGWDIPRANHLLQLRNINSESLNQQTLGRIKRFPDPNDYKEIYDEYFVFSNYQESTRELNAYELKKSEIGNFHSGNIEIIEEEEKMFIDNFELEVKCILDKNLKNIEFAINKIIKDRYLQVDGYTIKNKKIKKEIVTNIDNILTLRIWINSKIKNNLAIYNLLSATLQTFAESNNLNKEIFLYVFFIKYIEEVTELYQKSISNRKLFNYLVEDFAELPQRHIIWEGKDNRVDFEKIKDLYLYRNSDLRKRYIQVLDSTPEVIFMEEIIMEYIKESILKKDSKLLKMNSFFKNPLLNSGIKFNYHNDLYEKKTAYIDFVIRTNNMHYYVEVKSVKDYDEKKTDNIMKAFSNYSISNKNIVYVLAIIDKDNVQNNKYHTYSNGNYNIHEYLEQIFN